MSINVMCVKVWMRGDDPAIIKSDCAKYLKKRWKSSTKECVIGIDGREMDEGTGFSIDAYTSDREKVGEFASELFDAAYELRGEPKIYQVIIELFDEVWSESNRCTQDMEAIKKAYNEWLKVLAEKFKDHQRVKSIWEGQKKIIPVIDVGLSCELESERANKIFTYAFGVDLSHAEDLTKDLINILTRRGLVREVVGYELDNGKTEAYEIDDIDVVEDEVYVFLAQRSPSR